MKAIINYFKQRRERKLRKWCIGQAAKYRQSNPHMDAEYFYRFILDVDRPYGSIPQCSHKTP